MHHSRSASAWQKGLGAATCGLLLIAAITICATPATAVADSPQLNTLTEQEKQAGWKLLFDGKTTTGWRAFRGKSMPSKWKVEDGALILKPKAEGGGGDIVTADQYDSFELSLEMRISEGGNSGVMYHVSEAENAPYFTGPEYQILDNAKHPDGRSPLTSAASCYALYAPTKDVTKPVGEWNKTRISVKGNHVEHWLNDEKVVTYDVGGEDWDSHVKASKFKDMARFGKEPKGYIDLQDHGDEVAYRNIKIRPLSESGGAPPKDAIILFDGKDLSQWTNLKDENAAWIVNEGYFEVAPGKGNIKTKEKFGPDCKVHAEFWLPLMADKKGQSRANSGVFIQGRYEIQVLDSFMNDTYANGSCGALYGIIAPSKNANKPPEQWQTYDITFHAPRLDDTGKVVKKGQITIVFNGETIIDKGEFDKNTAGELDNKIGEPGPLMLQDHGCKIRFRNIWLQLVDPL